MKQQIALRIIIASVFFFGLLPLLIAWRQNMIAQGIIFLLSIAAYCICELVAVNKETPKGLSVQLSNLSGMLFLGILFLALAGIVRQYFTGSWIDELQIGFLMVAATYYSIALMSFTLLRRMT